MCVWDVDVLPEDSWSGRESAWEETVDCVCNVSVGREREAGL